MFFMRTKRNVFVMKFRVTEREAFIFRVKWYHIISWCAWDSSEGRSRAKVISGNKHTFQQKQICKVKILPNSFFFLGLYFCRNMVKTNILLELEFLTKPVKLVLSILPAHDCDDLLQQVVSTPNQRGLKGSKIICSFQHILMSGNISHLRPSTS